VDVATARSTTVDPARLNLPVDASYRSADPIARDNPHRFRSFVLAIAEAKDQCHGDAFALGETGYRCRYVHIWHLSAGQAFGDDVVEFV
jgi:hypothetical protein